MCGFAGFLSKWALAPDAEALLERMGQAILHRGPDSGGIWQDAPTGIGLSHRRLSILDVSHHGHQPMHSATGRYVLSYNGEVYNHLDLRAALEADQGSIQWRSSSDTETLLACFEAFGIEQTLHLCHGMFALALWDREARILTLARDRLGEKPLYYGWMADDFLFGSELKALKAVPSFHSDVDRQALGDFVRYGYVPAPQSIYVGIRKLMPGQILQVSREKPHLEPRSYWTVDAAIQAGLSTPFEGSEKEAVDELESQLTTSVKRQMISDVPLGAFLSGGIDSTTVVALMQANSSSKVNTFSIGFEDVSFNEAHHAKAVAARLGTNHEELYISSRQALDIIPDLPHIWDEPFADPSQIPTFIVSKLARSKVTVSLSGDGGDELFCGYNRYLVTAKLWRYMRPVPSAIRNSIGHMLSSVEAARWDGIAGWIPGNHGLGSVFDKLHKIAGILGAKNADAIYKGVVTSYPDVDSLLASPAGASFEPWQTGSQITGLCEVQRMMANDLNSYLPSDILTKLDRAAMAVSLEGRAPFLDHNVVEFAWRLPLSLKFRKGESKWVLKQVLYRYVDRKLMERPKMGFGVPLRDWLQGPLQGWAERLLDQQRLKQEGFFNAAAVRVLWAEHLSGKKNRSTVLWNILMFQAWLEHQ